VSSGLVPAIPPGGSPPQSPTGAPGGLKPAATPAGHAGPGRLQALERRASVLHLAKTTLATLGARRLAADIWNSGRIKQTGLVRERLNLTRALGITNLLEYRGSSAVNWLSAKIGLS